MFKDWNKHWYVSEFPKILRHRIGCLYKKMQKFEDLQRTISLHKNMFKDWNKRWYVSEFAKSLDTELGINRNGTLSTKPQMQYR